MLSRNGLRSNLCIRRLLKQPLRFCRVNLPVLEFPAVWCPIMVRGLQVKNSLTFTHIRSTPYHTRTNGMAERVVRTFKERLRAAWQPIGIDVTLNKFLFSYRYTPQKATKSSPAELFLGRRLNLSRICWFQMCVTPCQRQQHGTKFIMTVTRAAERSFF